jgi:hypothetical protein
MVIHAEQRNCKAYEIRAHLIRHFMRTCDLLYSLHLALRVGLQKSNKDIQNSKLLEFGFEKIRGSSKLRQLTS